MTSRDVDQSAVVSEKDASDVVIMKSVLMACASMKASSSGVMRVNVRITAIVPLTYVSVDCAQMLCCVVKIKTVRMTRFVLVVFASGGHPVS